jgi:hypothetical protein
MALSHITSRHRRMKVPTKHSISDIVNRVCDLVVIRLTLCFLYVNFLLYRSSRGTAASRSRATTAASRSRATTAASRSPATTAATSRGATAASC